MRDTWRVSTRVTVLVVADIDVPLAHGFVPRYEALITSLRRRAEVTVVGISPKIENVLPFTEMPLIAPMAFDPPGTSAMSRLATALHLLGGRITQSAWERELVGGLRFTEPDLIVTLNYRRRELTRLAARVAPTALFAEERSGLRWRRTRLAQLPPPVLMAFHDFAQRWSAGRAKRVCVIGPGEVQWAEESFRRPVSVVPLRIDTEWWAERVEADAAAGPFDVVTVGNLAEERNAEGLVDIIDALRAQGWPDGLRLRLVSATGFHPDLSERGSAEVVLEGKVADPRQICAGAVAVLVPAFRAFGVKTGILQGWAMGRCVVTTGPSAETVGGTSGLDLLSGATPEEVAAVIAGLPERDDLAGIAAAGADHLEVAFSAEAHDAAVDALLDEMGA